MVRTIIKSTELAEVFEAARNVVWQFYLHFWADKSFQGGTDPNPTVFLGRNGDLTFVPSEEFVAVTFAESDPSRLLGLNFHPQYGLTATQQTDLPTLEDKMGERPDWFGKGLVFVYDVATNRRYPIEIELRTAPVVDRVTGLAAGYLHVTMPQWCTQSLQAFCAQ